MAARDPLHGNARLQSSGARPPRLRHTTGAPVNDSTKFTILHVIGDNIGLPNKIAPDEDKVFVVGHDWGAYAAWYLCLYRPDRVKALVNLSIHYLPINPTMKPVEMFRLLHGDDHYICRFQVPGDIEAEFAQIETGNSQHLGRVPSESACEVYCRDLDLVYNIRAAEEYINNGGFKKDVPLLDEVVVMEGVAHFLNQEKPDEINKHILEFIKKF
ncbi:Bifunctional epoxide hydrolase 2 [Camellia lanceoleosa]|uniref:Bifunctional epoxide hydrolase 2 n=1 Tax=Camellia lanceoleosa TaxID=1840588 RepID=A0ACC0HIR0_9ERIC|nr:Bifunctional epoxide hydrolase 2 [Camellia lanceoleosa]